MQLVEKGLHTRADRRCCGAAWMVQVQVYDDMDDFKFTLMGVLLSGNTNSDNIMFVSGPRGFAYHFYIDIQCGTKPIREPKVWSGPWVHHSTHNHAVQCGTEPTARVRPPSIAWLHLMYMFALCLWCRR